MEQGENLILNYLSPGPSPRGGLKKPLEMSIRMTITLLSEDVQIVFSGQVNMGGSSVEMSLLVAICIDPTQWKDGPFHSLTVNVTTQSKSRGNLYVDQYVSLLFC